MTWLRTLRAIGVAAVIVVAAPAAPQSGPPSAMAAEAQPDVVVTGIRDIVVNGRARDCTRLPGDPLDNVVATPAFGERRQSEIVPNGKGGYVFRPTDGETPTASDEWARTGTGIEQYVFRNPRDGRPMCIGAYTPDRHTWAQYRRIVDAAPYRGKRVRFTAWVATGQAELVRFWLVSASRRNVYGGGDTHGQPWGGDHGWTPVMMEIGPVSPHADHISYGFLLYGRGSVWVYKPSLEVAAGEPPNPHPRDIAIIGNENRPAHQANESSQPSP